MSYEASATIDAPADEVWAVLHDVERWPDWSPTMTWVHPVDGPSELSTGTRKRIKQPGLPVNVWTVRSIEPGRSFTWTTGNRLVVVHAHHAVETLDDGRTRVTLGIAESGPLAAVVGRAFRRANKHNVDTELVHLRATCEARDPGPEPGSGGR